MEKMLGKKNNNTKGKESEGNIVFLASPSVKLLKVPTAPYPEFSLALHIHLEMQKTFSLPSDSSKTLSVQSK